CEARRRRFDRSVHHYRRAAWRFSCVTDGGWGAAMTLMVIGAGFGRTGTDSMREALTILGFGPCHHMYEVIANEDQKQLWRALAKGAAPVWEHLFKGYQSCMDWPSAHYCRQLIEVYPAARVILTYR